VYKGPSLKKIVVQTSTGEDGFLFKIGEEYLVYASAKYGEVRLDAQRKQLYTDACYGTRLASSAAADIEYLRNIKGSAKEVKDDWKRKQ
jgi:hypothetical protein